MSSTKQADTHCVISRHELAEVRERTDSGQKGLFALKDIREGEIIVAFSAAETRSKPNYLTVQTGENCHIILHPQYVQYINHHCDPNCFFDTTTMRLIALKQISKGEEFGFFYPSTEWIMQQPFSCYCGAGNCIGNVSGAANLTNEQAKQYRLTDFIMHKRNSTS